MDVAVLVGGASPEHDVSLASAVQVLAHLDRKRWRVWPVLLLRDGTWRVSRGPLVAGETWRPPDATSSNRPERDPMLPPMRPGAALDYLLDEAGVKVVFPVLHGPFGEDGTVQGMLELYGLPFVGSGCAASAVAMDKLRTRQVYQAGNVAMPAAYEPCGSFEQANAAHEFAAMRAAIGTPAFAKVDASGSTVGIARIETEADMEQFLAANRGLFRRWYAEQAIVGEEITVAVLGNTGRSPLALPPVGIYPLDDDWFTHDAKYRPGATEEVVPPRGLSAAMIEQVQQLGVRCHELLVCDGLSRTDMIVTDQGPIVLETNTLPGMTTTSLYPQAAAAAGITFSGLLDQLLELALERPSLVGVCASASAVVGSSTVARSTGGAAREASAES
ncbi:MAG: D-alanine-D-alanine ligase [Planctomycetota bacterium]|jgi:D-alanine-D-alanine ligase